MCTMLKGSLLLLLLYDNDINMFLVKKRSMKKKKKKKKKKPRNQNTIMSNNRRKGKEKRSYKSKGFSFTKCRISHFTPFKLGNNSISWKLNTNKVFNFIPKCKNHESGKSFPLVQRLSSPPQKNKSLWHSLYSFTNHWAIEITYVNKSNFFIYKKNKISTFKKKKINKPFFIINSSKYSLVIRLTF